MGRLAAGGETESEAFLGPQLRVVSCLAESFPDRAGGGTETGRRGGRVGRQAGRMGVGWGGVGSPWGWVDGLVSGGVGEGRRSNDVLPVTLSGWHVDPALCVSD
jgi:hypothetical protein